MKRVVIPFLAIAWLITTGQVSEVKDMNGNLIVTYKTYCTESNPKITSSGDIIIDKGQKDEIRIGKSYTVEIVDRCP